MRRRAGAPRSARWVALFASALALGLGVEPASAQSQSSSAASPFKTPLAATVHRLRKCLAQLPPGDRRLLKLRTGLGATPPLSPAQAASKLGLPLPREQRWEQRAKGDLDRAATQTGCGHGAPASGAKRSGATSGAGLRKSASGTTPHNGTPAGHKPGSARAVGGSSSGARTSLSVPPSGGWDRPGPLIALSIALLALLGVVREFVRVVR